MELGRVLVYPVPLPHRQPWEWSADYGYWPHEPDWKDRTRVGICLGLAALLHLLVLLYWPTEQTTPMRPVQLPPEKFVKQTLPERRPLARQVLPAPQRPLVRRPLAGPQRSAPTRVPTPGALTIQPPLGSQPLMSTPSPLPLAMLRSPELPMRSLGPPARAGAVDGARGAGEQIDLASELIDVQALDAGRRRAVVVVDPQDRRNLKGFLYLAGVYSPSIEQAERDAPLPRRMWNPRPGGMERREAERQTLQGLADKLTEQTQVRAAVRGNIQMDDPQLLEVPFVLVTVNNNFTFTGAEARNLGRYLTAGGFLYLENVYFPKPLGNDYTTDWPAMRELVRASLREVGFQEGKDWSFVRLDQDHPLFHCYYDIETLPMGWYDWTYVGATASHFSPEYIEGIEVGGRLVGLYSQKNYADFWGGEAEYIRTHSEIANERFKIGGEELPVYRLGVNVLVYALTREGSLAQKLVSE